MNIVNFTPISALLGGSLIGLAVVIFFVRQEKLDLYLKKAFDIPF